MRLVRLLYAAAIMSVLVLVGAWIWFNLIGWESFSFTGVVPYVKPTAACLAGQTCVGGFCAAGPCAAGGSCGKHATCTNRVCVTTTRCCAAGHSPAEGGCRPTCATDGECAAGACLNKTCQPGAVSWTAGGGQKLDRLRFKACTFTVTDPGGTTHTSDVAAVLNGMAAAHANSAGAGVTLSLDRGLNAFSFTIPGVNDPQTVATPSLWANCATSLTGEVRTL